MLIRFEASNYRSIATPVELSMVAVDTDRLEARDQATLGESLLSVAAIFGPNASGKSNVIAAFTWLRDAVLNSLRNWDDAIPVDPFAFGDAREKPSYFVIEYLIDGIRYDYELELDQQRVLFEGLFHYPEGRRRRIFEREGQDLKLQRGLGSLSGTRELLTETTLALSIARRFNEPLVNTFSRKLISAQTMGLSIRHPRGMRNFRYGASPSMATARIFDERERQVVSVSDAELTSEIRERNREQALALLKLADLGIDDVVTDTQQVRINDAGETTAITRIRLVHRTGEERVPFELAAESEGTRTWYGLIGPVLTALRTGTLLLFDELDASLHPTLSAELIRLFHDPVTNPRGAQIVFTTHDTSLLNHLNRDEVWLTEKRTDGSTRLGALSDFAGERVRKSQNLESAYLHGRFGALPEVDQSAFLRALGLIG